MAGLPMEQAAAALATVERAVTEVSQGLLQRRTFERRTDDALEVVSACMQNLNATQSEVTRHRLIDTAEKAWLAALAEMPRHDVREWVQPFVSKMETIARGGA